MTGWCLVPDRRAFVATVIVVSLKLGPVQPRESAYGRVFLLSR
jgi:hypothetical protein